MKKMSLLFMMGIFLVSSVSMFAQCKLTSGDIKMLKDQSSINLQYDYSNMAIGKFKTDDEYVANKTKEMNKKKPGSGDDWAVKWKSDRESRFQPAFERNLNMLLERFKSSGRTGASNAKYTLIIHTTFAEMGFSTFGYGPRKSAYISLVVDLVETSIPSKILASIEMRREEGHYYGDLEVDAGLRMQSCYERAGEELGGFLVREAFK